MLAGVQGPEDRDAEQMIADLTSIAYLGSWLNLLLYISERDLQREWTRPVRRIPRNDLADQRITQTVGSMRAFFLALVTNPEVQTNAQAELDAVVGPDRLPTHEDRPQLPYIEAIISEVLRWHPVVPLGLPHLNTADDNYKGYFIPKGSIIMGNVWYATLLCSMPHFIPCV